MKRALQAIRSLVAWYASATGLIYAIAMAILVLVMALIDDPTLTSLVLLVVLGALVPYKLAREREDRNAGLTSTRRGIAGAQKAAEDFSMAERKHFAQSLEAVRQEWVDTLMAERMIWTEDRVGLTEADENLSRRVEDLHKDVSHRLDAIDGRLEEDGALVTADDLNRRLNNRLLETTRALNLGIARSSAHGRSPKDLLLLIAPQRTGSTWLLDLLRAHPGIDFWPTADIYTTLGIEGNRYPGHLANGASASLPVEMQHGTGAMVPDFNYRGIPPTNEHMSVEKAHPAAFGFDASGFLSRVQDWRTSRASRVEMIYVVRHPADAIRSFLSYQKRADRWHTDIAPSEVPSYYLRSFETTADMIAREPGPVIIYEDLGENPVDIMRALYGHLFGSVSPNELDRIARYAVGATAKNQREETQSGPFIAPKAVASRVALEFGPDLAGSDRNRDTIEKCVAVYESILNAQTRIRPNPN